VRVGSAAPATLEYRPTFPAEYRPGVAIIGCGAIAKSHHLPAYARYGVNVVGVYDPLPAATEGLREQFPFVRRVFDRLDDVLRDPAVDIVDIATRPDVRVALIEQAAEAGKHVLAQKPLAPHLPDAARATRRAEQLGVKVAVNQNGRWSPPWRLATVLLEQGAIGDVFAVTHLHDRPLPPLVGTHFDELPHFTIYDYCVHWIDICRCWFADRTVAAVRAVDYRTPDQPARAKSPWGAWIEIRYTDGGSALIRSVGAARTANPSCPFWIHGTEGTIRGSVLLAEALELERDGVTEAFELEGEWRTEGFAGTLAELASAIAEDREPFNSARHNLVSLQLTLAACRSADEAGRPVRLDEVGGLAPA
jgi:predicted dehydrogenase